MGTVFTIFVIWSLSVPVFAQPAALNMVEKEACKKDLNAYLKAMEGDKEFVQVLNLLFLMEANQKDYPLNICRQINGKSKDEISVHIIGKLKVLQDAKAQLKSGRNAEEVRADFQRKPPDDFKEAYVEFAKDRQRKATDVKKMNSAAQMLSANPHVKKMNFYDEEIQKIEQTKTSQPLSIHDQRKLHQLKSEKKAYYQRHKKVFDELGIVFLN